MSAQEKPNDSALPDVWVEWRTVPVCSPSPFTGGYRYVPASRLAEVERERDEWRDAKWPKLQARAESAEARVRELEAALREVQAMLRRHEDYNAQQYITTALRQSGSEG